MSAKRILIIDDEYDIRAVAELALKTVARWEAIGAASGSEGVDKAATHQPDAILLDVMMPDMDGIATLQALQANSATSSIPVIMMTANTQPDDQRRFFALGVAGIITKPFKAMQLPAQVAAALGWKQ